MKKIAVILLILSFILPVFAQNPPMQKRMPVKKFNNMSTGTFKKKRDGTIVQYNEQGKKIGTYKLENSGYKKVK